jgi:hypothetical protein
MIDAESKMSGEVGISDIISDQSVIKTSEDIIDTHPIRNYSFSFESMNLSLYSHQMFWLLILRSQRQACAVDDETALEMHGAVQNKLLSCIRESEDRNGNPYLQRCILPHDFPHSL